MDCFTNKEREIIRDVPGLTLIIDYISPLEETSIWNKLEKEDWIVDYSRKLQYYNYRNELEKPYNLIEYPYSMPDCISNLLDRVVEDRIVDKRMDQVIINDYEPGQGIKPHFDRKDYYDRQICGVSLGSGCMMEFTSPEGKKVSVYIPNRSLYILEGDARFKWKHGIPGRKKDKLPDGSVVNRNRRISITYRKIIQSQVREMDLKGTVANMLRRAGKLL